MDDEHQIESRGVVEYFRGRTGVVLPASVRYEWLTAS
jgi:hypothetical protein